MKRALLLATILLTAPSFAAAHVSVRPRESKAGAEERYTVRVPTEGAVATTHVRLEIPANVTVLELLPADGATFETLKDGERVTAITWKKEIPPKQAAEFVLLARNPAASEIVWKAHQHFADGTTAEWIGAAGERRPAAVTKLAAASAPGTNQPAGNETAAIRSWLEGYDAAFSAKDLAKLATVWEIRHSHTSSRPRRPAGE